MFSNESLFINLPTKFGDYTLHYFADDHTGKEHLALAMGNIYGKKNVLTRIHSECLTGDIFGSQRCDCGEQLEHSLKLIEGKGAGLLIYLRQEGRGIGLLGKLKAYKLQEQGYDTVDANLMLGHQVDERQYHVAINILRELDIKSVNLLTNNPLKIEALRGEGIAVHQIASLQPTINENNKFYLQTKKKRMGHTLHVPGL